MEGSFYSDNFSSFSGNKEKNIHEGNQGLKEGSRGQPLRGRDAQLGDWRNSWAYMYISTHKDSDSLSWGWRLCRVASVGNTCINYIPKYLGFQP